MSLCVVTGEQCSCEPMEGRPCPEVIALRARVAQLERVGERGCFVLMEMMQAYERRVRSDCKTEDEIAARPWECAEYLKAAEYLRKVWTPATEKQP